MSEDASDRDLGVLRSKGDATRYLILVEVAKRQPAVSQKEIGDSIGVTSQAVSDYLRDLVERGHVEKGGRGRYRVTNEGVDWMMTQTDSLRDLTEYVTDEVVEEVDVEAAVADDAVDEGDSVAVGMRDGFLHVTPDGEDDAGSGMTAVAATDGDEGDVVGITGFEGVLDYDRGDVTVISVPSVENGGGVRSARVTEADGYGFVACSGVEAYVALNDTGVEADTVFGTEEAVVEAATKGVDVLLVVVEDELSRHIDRLREAGVGYEVVS